MATYTVTGHPIGPPEPLTVVGLAEQVRVLLQEHGVGTSITIVLNVTDETKLKGHGALR
jgi:hypothetical protein